MAETGKGALTLNGWVLPGGSETHQHYLAQGAGVKSETHLWALKECSGDRTFQSKGQGP